jgi:hypothetical protein
MTTFGGHRFNMHIPVGYMEHKYVLQTISLLGTDVKPLFKD